MWFPGHLRGVHDTVWALSGALLLEARGACQAAGASASNYGRPAGAPPTAAPCAQSPLLFPEALFLARAPPESETSDSAAT